MGGPEFSPKSFHDIFIYFPHWRLGWNLEMRREGGQWGLHLFNCAKDSREFGLEYIRV